MQQDIAVAVREMAAAYDMDAFARGMIQGAAATIKELARMGVIKTAEQQKEEEQ